MNSDFTRPLNSGFTLAIKLYENISPGIVGLLRPCFPSAIRWPIIVTTMSTFSTGIVTGIVDSFKTHACWPGTEIKEKGFKRVAPTRAHRNASCSVPMKVTVRRIKTSAFSGSPNQIFRRVTQLVSHAGFLLKTSARSCAATLKKTGLSDGYFPAVTQTIPAASFSATSQNISSFVLNYQPSESEAGKVLEVVRVLDSARKIKECFQRFIHTYPVFEFSDGRTATTGAHCA